jgi:hypothetical protein
MKFRLRRIYTKVSYKNVDKNMIYVVGYLLVQINKDSLF